MSEADAAVRLLRLARRDFRAAEVLSRQTDVDDSVAGFHFQQAAEKACKAWLSLLGASYPKTHDLSLLLYLLEEKGADVAGFWDLLNLNPFAVQLRYDILDDEPLDCEEASQRVSALLAKVGEILAQTNS